MALAAERAPGSKSYFLLAVSDDTDPNDSWYKYRIDVTNLAGGDIDSPNIAVDTQAVYLSADFFTGGQKYLVYILEKEPLLSGSIGETRDMLITGSQSYGLPVIYGNPPAMYMIEHFEASTNTKVRLHAITDSLGTPQRVTYDLNVPSYSPPEDPPQKGTSTRPQTFDSRFWSCMWRDGSLWATHHQGSSRVMARWYEIKTNDWPSSGVPELVQSGDIDPGPDIRTFFTSIAADGYSNAAMCFARSSPNEYISMARCMRLSSDPLGTMRDVVIVKNSSAPYNYGRWGDYSGVNCDPSDDCTFWMHAEYTPGGNSWNTWISCCKAPNRPPDPPAIAGPTIGAVGIEYEYTLETTDPEGEDVHYYVEWGDETNSGWIGPYPSGKEVTVSHTWTSPDDYETRAKAKDTNDAESEWSDVYPVTIVKSEPPEKPIITGPKSGKPRVLLTFTFVSIDPEGHDLYYMVNWGDGHYIPYDRAYASGEEVTFSHSWSQVGDYTIVAKAKDQYGAKSPQNSFKLSITKNRAVTKPILLQLLEKIMEQFPLLHYLLYR